MFTGFRSTTIVITGIWTKVRRNSLSLQVAIETLEGFQRRELEYSTEVSHFLIHFLVCFLPRSQPWSGEAIDVEGSKKFFSLTLSTAFDIQTRSHWTQTPDPVSNTLPYSRGTMSTEEQVAWRYAGFCAIPKFEILGESRQPGRIRDGPRNATACPCAANAAIRSTFCSRAG
jgi:hypothetical protein